MSEPTGPHGSLLVAGESQLPLSDCVHSKVLTIADLDLHSRVALRDILDAPYDLRHVGRGGTASSSLRRSAVGVGSSREVRYAI